MAAFRKLTSPSELQRVVLGAAGMSPLGKHASQLVKEVSIKKLEANVFVDQWPKFTTVITQEFSPRLSEVVDLRIFSTDKDKVMPIINGAKLLDNIGAWQLIHYVEEDTEDLTSYLMDSLKKHPATKEKTLNVIFDYHVHEVIKSPLVPMLNITSEFVLRELKLEDAEFIAPYWIPATVDYPPVIKIRFIRDVMTKFDMLGIYKIEDEKEGHPVSWFGIKPGGMVGMGYTLKTYRNKNLYEIVSWESAKRGESRGDYIFAEFHEYPDRMRTFGKIPRNSIGKSKIIAIT